MCFYVLVDFYCNHSVSVPSASVGRLESRVHVLRALANMVLTAKNTPATPAAVTELSSRPTVLPVGTVVRRGPDWRCVSPVLPSPVACFAVHACLFPLRARRYGKSDGGPGSLGKVLGMKYFDAEKDKGVSVVWDHKPQSNRTYRWGAEGGKYDVEIVSLPPDASSEGTSKASHTVAVTHMPWTLELKRFIAGEPPNTNLLDKPVHGDGDGDGGGWQHRSGRRGKGRKRKFVPSKSGSTTPEPQCDEDYVKFLITVLRQVLASNEGSVCPQLSDWGRLSGIPTTVRTECGVHSLSLNSLQVSMFLEACRILFPSTPHTVAASPVSTETDGGGVGESKGDTAMEDSDSGGGASSMDDDDVTTPTPVDTPTEANASKSFVLPRLKALLDFTYELCQWSTVVLQRFTDAAVAAKTANTPVDRYTVLEDLLHVSVIGAVLPLTVSGLSALPIIPSAAVYLLPSLINLTQHVDALCELLPSVQASEKALLVYERACLDQDASTLTAPTLHWLHDLEQSLCAVAGKYAAACIAGLSETEEEEGTCVGFWL